MFTFLTLAYISKQTTEFMEFIVDSNITNDGRY